MDGIYQLGIAFIQWLQQLSPELDGFMRGATFLGTIEFYIVFIPALYWSVDQTLGLRVLFILILTDIPASAFKQIFHQPRPYWFGGIKALSEEPSYGIPSSHASNTLSVWGLIAYSMKQTWMWVFTVVLLLLIGLSRPYLGMHFPQDVLVGWLIGLVVLLLFLKYESRFLAWWRRKTVNTRIWLGFLASIGVILLGMLVLALIAGDPDPPEWAQFATEARELEHYITLAGFLFGAITGVTLTQKYARFKMDGSAFQRTARYVIGMIGLFAVYLGLDILFSLFAPDASLAGYLLRYIRYTSVSLWAAFLAPWMFIKLGLAERS